MDTQTSSLLTAPSSSGSLRVLWPVREGGIPGRCWERDVGAEAEGVPAGAPGVEMEEREFCGVGGKGGVGELLCWPVRCFRGHTFPLRLTKTPRAHGYFKAFLPNGHGVAPDAAKTGSWMVVCSRQTAPVHKQTPACLLVNAMQGA